MIRYLLATILIVLVATNSSLAQQKQVLELRTYELVDTAAEAKLDAYLADALIPALKRQGLGPIGAFNQAAPQDGKAADESTQVILLIPGPSTQAVTRAAAKLTTDEQYQQAAADYLSTPADKPLLVRIRSELLMSFDVWPQVTVPQQAKTGKDRLFELRIYESANEKLGELKVEMFNSGEVPIFLDSNVMPVFMGQALVGNRMPNLTYMTVYDNHDARQSAWKKFVSHPDWKVLSKDEKYQGTVSKIHKSDWVPKPYSEL